MSRKKRMRKLMAQMTARTHVVQAGDDCPICRMLAGAETTELGNGISVSRLTPEMARAMAALDAVPLPDA